jgi:hypothetical protein
MMSDNKKYILNDEPGCMYVLLDGLLSVGLVNMADRKKKINLARTPTPFIPPLII